ncbi:hypothetical protein ANCCAN_18318 [Ancylostoma caninum]|uniref:Uncharacterized protein n=1 Tax=Ancylostoma caninum TaxID=29170 RepID=A0A368FUB9_ANCCA|nr:hypothetical protein ANCCAN_18318 [Ancylostoma caninum]
MLVTISISMMCVPTMMLHEIFEVAGSRDQTLSSTPSYTLDFANYSCAFYKFNLWMLAVVMKVRKDFSASFLKNNFPRK